MRAEADVARESGTLAQASLDEARLPLPFNRIQCANLAGWAGDETSAGWRKLAESVAALVGGPADRPSPEPHRSHARSATPERFSVAVSPFSDSSSSGDGLAEGLAGEIVTALARFSFLAVTDASWDARPLYVLGGAIQRSGGMARINLQLREAATGERIWADRLEGALDDPFALQDDVSVRAAARIEPAILAHASRRIRAASPERLTAQELWLRARETFRHAGVDDLAEAQVLCERALGLEPRHGGALGLLACALAMQVAYGDGADAAPLRTRISETIKRALLAGADDADVLTWVAEAHLLAENDTASARALADRALAMNPALGVAWDIAANTRLRTGEYAEALALYERCLALDPKSPWRTYVYGSMGGCLAALGRFEEAVPLLKECLQIAPANSWAAATLAAVEVATGRIDEARSTLVRLDRRQVGILQRGALGPPLQAMVERALAATGWRAEA